MSSHEKPIILIEGKYNKKHLNALKGKVSIRKVVDIYENQLCELFAITHPTIPRHSRLYANELDRFLKRKLPLKKTKKFAGNWIYFPWSKLLLHMVKESDYNILRTNRNRNLITKEEQKKLFTASIGIAGLSIGNSIALNLVYSGIGNVMKLAEYDTLETTNLNRLRARVDQVGVPKLQVTIHQIYEINPYINLYVYPEGLRAQTLSSFVAFRPKPKIIFDEIDDFAMKVLIRKEAKKQKVPLVMLTNIGDTVLIDIERYDIDSNAKPFNGMVSEDVLEKIIAGKVSEGEKHEYALQIVGQENITHRALASVKAIGTTLVGRPQLMGTVAVASGIASFIARKIILGDLLASGRTLVRFDDFLYPKLLT